jgi:hypothetical protein
MDEKNVLSSIKARLLSKSEAADARMRAAIDESRVAITERRS